MTRPYHHGNLRQALVETAADLAREKGPDGVVLREVARRTGVSHNAAYRHFADRDQLLAEVAVDGMVRLADHMRAEIAQVDDADPVVAARRRLSATGRAYVGFALAEPGFFAVAFADAAHELMAETIGSQEPVATADADPSDIVVHDAHNEDPSTAFAISRLTDSGYLNQSPVGIFRQVERPTYDDRARAQVEASREGLTTTPQDRLAALIGAGDTWSVV